MVLFEGHPKFLQMKKYIAQYPELFFQPVPQDWKENRVLTDRQLEKVLESGLIDVGDYDDETLFVFGEYLHYINPSLAIKMGVDIILFGGALRFLGGERHRGYLEKLVKGQIKGCFSMTEIGHGSNLKNLMTTAKKVGNTLVIDSMGPEGVKCWIGGSTITDYTVVFCQLYDEENVHQGLHAILVPLKTENKTNYPGVTIEDMGAKIGLNGIDNGYIKFSKVEVPLENLLDKYGGFDENGKYKSTIKNKDVRFGYMLSALSMGRISIAMGSYSIAYKAFIVALNYNLQRRQFMISNNKEEKRIIEYYSQLQKFAIMYSSLYAMRLGILDLIKMYKREGFSKKVHAISSLLKVYCSWMAIKITGWCREMCGGHGYLWENQLGLFMNDVNIYQTFEGDNSVLIQQGTKWIIDEFSKHKLDGVIKYLKGYSVLGTTVEKIQNKFHLDLGGLVFKLTGKNKQQIWLNQLNQIIRVGIDYTKIYLLNGIDNKLVMEIYSQYIHDDKIPNESLNKILKTKVFEGIIEKWNNGMKETTNYIPITRYPNYYSKL